MVRIKGYALVATVAALLFCGKAAAQSSVWTGDDDDNTWSNNDNWSGENVPNNNDVFFNLEGATSATVDRSFSIASLTVSNGSGSLTLTSLGDPLAISTSFTDASSNNVTVDQQITGASTLTVCGSGTLTFDSATVDFGTVILHSGILDVSNGGDLEVGSVEVGQTISDNATLSIEDGSKFNASGQISVGGSGYGSLTVDGTNSLLTAHSSLIIGNSGTGSMAVTNGGQVNSGIDGSTDLVGYQSGSSGAVTVDGTSSAWNDTSLILGYSGTGALTLSDGGTLTSTSGLLSLGGNGGTATLNIGAPDGDEPANPGILNVGTLTGESGSVLQFNTSSSSECPTYFTTDGTSTGTPITIMGNMGVVINNGAIVLNGQSTYSGDTTVNGGDLEVGSSSTFLAGTLTSGPIGTGNLILNSGASLSPFTDVTLGNNVTLNGCGLIPIGDDDSDSSIIFTGIISGTGGIDWCGNGALTLSGANTFQGTLDMRSGTLILGSSTSGGPGCITSGPVGLGTLELEDGSNLQTAVSDVTLSNKIILDDEQIQFDGDSGNNLKLLGYITGSGGINWLSAGTLELAGANDFSAGVEVHSGTLQVDTSTVGNPGCITSGPAGTGTLSFDDGSVLAIPTGATICLANAITINDNCFNSATMTIGAAGGDQTGVLTLKGVITDNNGTGNLVINTPTVLKGANTYGGTTDVSNTTVTVTKDSGFGSSGYLTATGSDITFTSHNPELASADLYDETTLSFTAACGSPFFGEVSLHNSSLVFGAGLTPTIASLTSDGPGDESTITLQGSDTVLTFNDTTDPSFYGNILGSGGLVFTSATAAEYDLYGTNSYTGGTTVGGNAILAAGSNAAFGDSSGTVKVQSGAVVATLAGVCISNPITLCSGATIAGNGTFAPGVADTFNISDYTTIAAGAGTTGLAPGGTPLPAPGTLAFGSNASLVFGPDGILQFSLLDASGTPGEYTSLITTAGTLQLTTNSGTDPFTIQVMAPSSLPHFSPSASYSWTLVSATGGITGFDLATFQVNQSLFNNPTNGGTFAVTESGNNLMLNFTPVPEPSTWALLIGGAVLVGVSVWRRNRRSVAR